MLSKCQNFINITQPVDVPLDAPNHSVTNCGRKNRPRYVTLAYNGTIDAFTTRSFPRKLIEYNMIKTRNNYRMSLQSVASIILFQYPFVTPSHLCTIFQIIPEYNVD